MMRSSRVVLALMVLALSSCASQRMIISEPEGIIQWPAEEPRVRLVAVVAEEATGRGFGDVLHGGVSDQDRAVFARPYGVAWQDKDLLVTDTIGSKVVRIAPNGTISSSPRFEFDTPVAIAVCANGIYVADSRPGAVWLLDNDLKKVRAVAENLARPSGLACHGQSLIIAETAAHQLRIIDQAGRGSTLGGRGVEPGQFNFPTALAIDGDTIWVGDTLNFRLQRLGLPKGDAMASFGRLGDAPGEMPRIKGVATHPNGTTWLTDERLDQISLFNESGDFLLAVGESGHDPGFFKFPAGIAIRNDGLIAVVDSLNRRIQLFEMTEDEP